MTHKEYNGWTNYETWLVKLWMDNDEGSNGYWTERAKAMFDAAESDRIFTKMERAAIDLQDDLQARHEEIIDEAMPSNTGFIADLINAAMSEVNWREIADSLLNAVAEEISTEELAAQ